MIPIASNHSGARKKTHIWFEYVQPAITEEVKNMCEDIPPGFKYSSSFAKKLRVVGEKKSDDKKVSGAPNQRILFVENLFRQTYDKDMAEYINSIVSTEYFQHQSVDEASRKSYKFKVFACDVCKLLDPDVWPEGIGCKLWEFRGRNQHGSNSQLIQHRTYFSQSYWQ